MKTETPKLNPLVRYPRGFQTGLAKHFNVSRQAVHRWLRGYEKMPDSRVRGFNDYRMRYLTAKKNGAGK